MKDRKDYYSKTVLALTVGYFAITIVASGVFYFGGQS